MQIDIPEKINKQLKLYRIDMGYANMEEAIIDILASKFNIEDYEYG